MLENKLNSTRKDLLDLSARNRLINTRRSAARSSRLDVVDELAEEVFRILIVEKRKMSFLGKPENSTSVARVADASAEVDEAVDEFGSYDLEQPDEEVESGTADRHTDDKLQTNLIDEALQKKLLKLSYEARTSEEEQGVNTLYLAIGFLKWFESNQSAAERQAPLLLIPVTLERTSANARFRLRWDENEISTNLSLQEKLRSEFGIELPEICDIEDFSPTDYFNQVRKAIADKKEWELFPDAMVLWFFSFAKFLMYKDLDATTWPPERALTENGLIGGLLGEGFQSEPPICGEEQNVDEFFKPIDLIHVVDADSSQTLAIEESKTGRNMVIQGPPGTGKSQTITNIIAAAIADGKKVLFVAEKMAALQVVHRRLENVGLGAVCLELHSHTANKKAVLQELETTLELGKPKSDNNRVHAEELESCRDRLNRHSSEMHARLKPSCRTPYQIVGELVRLQSAGAIAPEFEFPDASQWSPEVYRNNLGLVKDLALHLKTIENPAAHTWIGIEVDALLPADHARIQKQIDELRDRVSRLQEANREIANVFDATAPDSLAETVTLANVARLITKAPKDVDSNCICSSVWRSDRQGITELIHLGKTCQLHSQTLQPLVADVAWDSNLSETRRHLRAYGRSWFRFFNTRYRNAKADLIGILKGDLPKGLDEQLEIVDGMIVVQDARRKLASQEQLGKQAFGNDWSGESSNWEKLETVIGFHLECDHQNLPSNFFSVAADSNARSSFKRSLAIVKENLNVVASELKSLFSRLKLKVSKTFDTNEMKKLSIGQLSERLSKWSGESESLSQWIGYTARIKKLPASGMNQLADRIEQGAVPADTLVHQFQACYFEQLMRTAYATFPRLAEFDGRSHEQTLQRFRDLDIERREFARRQVAATHYNSLPNRAAQAGEIAIVKREIAKKRRHLPIRKLLAQAGHAVQAIKPVFMMSPISVAQFLEPGVLEFDLLLIDEASQVKPVDALGSMARAKQVIVVGDERQLPPTNFFNKMTEADDEAEGDDDFSVKDMESVLGLCSAQNMNQRMLRWHYRSRHHSLIAVSNYEFYDSKLFVVPSPNEVSETLGLSFVHVKNGVYDRGKSRTNRIEAAEVADAVIEHAKLCPHKSLGVAAFSVAQRDAILNEVELRRRSHPELEDFFVTGGAEPFFVKNIENVQGDERDSIFISVGYGRDESGYATMSFGPLQTDGGERRLNVLISRAKEKCVVFSSYTPDDIDLNRAKSRGVAAFKTFLTYARSKILDVAAQESDREMDSEFERQVAKSITGRGYDVQCQIGVAGFYIDLAIVDPDQPGRFLIGIECDGATYHSSRSARDRDRIRQAVLEDRGWIIHRIWSTDWFQRPDEQLRAVVAAIEEAKVDWASRDNCDNEVALETFFNENNSFQLEREQQPDMTLNSTPAVITVPYREANFSINSSQDIHQLSPEQLGRVVESVVQIEGPVHMSEISRRIAGLWGMNRTGSRITQSVDDAIEYMVQVGKLRKEGEFVSHRTSEVKIRFRQDVQSSNLKKPELLPPSEIAAAIVAIVQVNLGIEPDDLAREAALLFGFKSTSAKLKSTIQNVIDQLVAEGKIESRNGRLYAVIILAEKVN